MKINLLDFGPFSHIYRAMKRRHDISMATTNEQKISLEHDCHAMSNINDNNKWKLDINNVDVG